MSENGKGNPPAFNVFVVSGEGDKSQWTEVGAAWANKNGRGFTITLRPHLAVSGRLICLPPKDRSED